MSLEQLFLVLFIAAVSIYAFFLATAAIVFYPWGLIGLFVLLFAGYIVWRLISEHRNNPEDRYYEDNFDK